LLQDPTPAPQVGREATVFRRSRRGEWPQLHCWLDRIEARSPEILMGADWSC
jgi:hypothetical protein